jgi:hypothetical protein
MSIKKLFLLILLLADILVLGLIFSVSGFYNDLVDAKDYIPQIEEYAHPGSLVVDTSIAHREFKPLYGILGGPLARYTDARTALLILNIFFFIGLSFAAFFFLDVLGFSSIEALVGALWIISDYPLLKYGLTLSTDISGWFFAALIAAIGLFGVRAKKWWPLLLASTFGFIGFLAKETAVLGLGAVGFMILFSFTKGEWRQYLKSLIAISLPFLLLEGGYVAFLIHSGIPTFLDWYQGNAAGISSHQTVSYFLGIEGASFHVLLILALIGFYFSLQNGDIWKKDWLIKFSSLFLASLPVLVWPIYITRIIYVQFIFVVPLALYGAEKVLEKIDKESLRRAVALTFAIIPIAASIILFVFANGRSLFDVLHLL